MLKNYFKIAFRNLMRNRAFSFINITALAIFIAWPIGYFIMKSWLQNFAYKIQINLAYFLLAGIATCAVAIITVSFQTIKAANGNPVKALNYE